MFAASLFVLSAEYVDGLVFLMNVPPVGLIVLLAEPGAMARF